MEEPADKIVVDLETTYNAKRANHEVIETGVCLLDIDRVKSPRGRAS
jgi:hypothetical protein